MKRTVLSVLFVCLVSAFVPAQQTQAEPPAPEAAILFNPIGLALGALTGTFAFDAEFQAALSDHFVLVATPGMGFIPGFNILLWSLELGAQFMPLGGGLEGFYITLQPGIFGFSTFIGFVATAVIGYQWVYDTGFVFSLGGGARYFSTTGIAPRLKIAFGFAF